MMVLAVNIEIHCGNVCIGKNASSSLFAKQISKPPPAYDYTKIPARTNKRKNVDDDNDNSDDEVEKVSIVSRLSESVAEPRHFCVRLRHKLRTYRYCNTATREIL
jgi:hypothetical protein